MSTLMEQTSEKETKQVYNNHNDEELEIDLMDLLRKVIGIRKKIYKAAGIGLIIGVIVAISIPKQYTVEVTLSPEMGNNKGGGLSGLAASFLAYGGYLEGIVDTWVMKFSTFNPEQGWLKSPFADPIKDMYPQYRDMMNKTDDPVALAFGKILRVCIMHRVTDIYGPIPYSKMMDNDNSGEDLAVPYDSQEQVYTQMLKELEEADKVLEENKDLS